MAEADTELTSRVKQRALSLGFVRAGVAAVGDLGPKAAHFRDWIARGQHGEMAYLEETADVRVDPRHPGMLPSARTVFVVASSYGGAEEDAPAPVRIARYARGRDYHNVLRKRLKRIAAFLREEGHAARTSVDTLPVLERAWAQEAGVGFIGKNACLIVPGIGSHVFLGAVVTSAPLCPDAPMQEKCGTCRACLDACPTSAFTAPRDLDARRCIAYLTIELRGAIPEPLRAPIGDWMFGCDVCQDVCPYNRGHSAPPPDPAFAPSRFRDLRPEEFLAMDDAAFLAAFSGSPLRRAGRVGLARNAAIVLGNTGDKRHLPILQDAARHHDAAIVRDAAGWALRRLDGG